MIMRVYQTGQIASRVQRIPLTRPDSLGLKINAVDEDSRADGTRWGGVQAYWAKEADAATPSKPKFRQIELQLQKLIALCYATDETISDAGALEIVLARGFAKEMTFKLEDAIFNGTGSVQPIGLLNTAATLVVAKDSGDSGATISTNDVLNMWSHLWTPSRQDAAWFINPPSNRSFIL